MQTQNDMEFYSEEMSAERTNVCETLKNELIDMTLMLQSAGVYAEAIDPRFFVFSLKLSF